VSDGTYNHWLPEHLYVAQGFIKGGLTSTTARRCSTCRLFRAVNGGFQVEPPLSCQVVKHPCSALILIRENGLVNKKECFFISFPDFFSFTFYA
jgi:hypothetical protein